MKRCGTSWAVCPHCKGQELVVAPDGSFCPQCHAVWEPGAREPCPDPCSVVVTDRKGTRAIVCESHAAAVLRAIKGTKVFLQALGGGRKAA